MKCHICEKKATHKSVDPFSEELQLRDDEAEELEEEWWCDECYQERLYAI